MGPIGLRQFLGGPARHRHLPPGESGIPLADRVDEERGRHRTRLSGQPRRHRLAHHHGQRSRGAGLGRRRHRGRGRDAGAAALHADPGGHRLQAVGQAARGHHRHRPRAHRHPDAAQEGRRWQVRRVLRTRPRRHGGGRPRHDLQHGPRIRRHLRLLPHRPEDHRLPHRHRPRRRPDRPRGGLRQGAGHVARCPDPGPRLHRHARTGHGRRAPVARRPQAPAGPRAPGRCQAGLCPVHGDRVQEGGRHRQALPGGGRELRHRPR